MNIQKMMKQAQQMQQKMADMQEELAKREFDGAAGGGMVKVTVSGKGIMLKLDVDASLVDKDEKDMMEDLIIAAFNDAKQKADDASQNELGELTSGMGLPGNLKMPF